MLLLVPLLSALASAGVPGTVLPVAPPVAPGRIAPLPEDPIAQARMRWQHGDANGVVALMAPYAKTKKSRKDDKN